MRDTRPRVVITGLGTVNPLGLDVETSWQNLLAGKSVIRRITQFDPSPFRTQIAAEIDGFDPEEYMDAKDARRIDRFVQLAIASVHQALAQSKLTIDETNAYDIGIIIGSGIGGLRTINAGYEAMNTRGVRWVDPLTGAMMIVNIAAGQAAIDFGAKGPNFCVVSACATGSHVIGEAFEIIRRGDAVAMIAGGSESAIVPFGMAAFDRIGALSRRNDDPGRASRPFDAKRDGFVFGEGAAALVLESLEYAEARGARILAELVGYGATSDASHITAPAEGGVGAAKAIEKALAKAGLKPGDVDYINAHGTSTQLNDKAETQAIKRVFGEYAYKIPISSTKSMTGHLLGTAGVMGGLVCVLTILHGVIHPTINYEYFDPECDLDYVPNRKREAKVRVAISNSFGFGGHNACLVFKAFQDGAS